MIKTIAKYKEEMSNYQYLFQYGHISTSFNTKCYNGFLGYQLPEHQRPCENTLLDIKQAIGVVDCQLSKIQKFELKIKALKCAEHYHYISHFNWPFCESRMGQ